MIRVRRSSPLHFLHLVQSLQCVLGWNKAAKSATKVLCKMLPRKYWWKVLCPTSSQKLDWNSRLFRIGAFLACTEKWMNWGSLSSIEKGRNNEKGLFHEKCARTFFLSRGSMHHKSERVIFFFKSFNPFTPLSAILSITNFNGDILTLVEMKWSSVRSWLNYSSVHSKLPNLPPFSEKNQCLLEVGPSRLPHTFFLGPTHFIAQPLSNLSPP